MITGGFINLDRSTDRRSRIENRLAAAKLPFQVERFKAVTPEDRPDILAGGLKPAVAGCWASHYSLITAHRHDPRHLLVLEDDIMPSVKLGEWLEPAIRTVDQGEWDILYLDGIVANGPDMLNLFNRTRLRGQRREGLVISPLTTESFTGAMAYVLNGKKRDLICNVLDAAWPPKAPIDLLFRNLFQAGFLKAFVTLPFLTAPEPESMASTINDEYKRSFAVIDAYRQTMFIDTTDAQRAEFAERALAGRPTEPDLLGVSRLAAFLMTPDFLKDFGVEPEK